MRFTLSCLDAIPMDLCGFCLLWLRPHFVLFRCFSAGETQIWPGDLRVVAVAVFFLSLSGPSLRARSATTEEKKRIAMLVASSSDCSYYCACHNVNSFKLAANRPKAKKNIPITTKSMGTGQNTRVKIAQKRKSNASGIFGTWNIEAR